MKIRWVPVALAATVSLVHAAELPSAGSQIKQIPSVQTPPKAAPQFRIEKGSTQVAPSGDSATIVVNSLRVANAHAFTEADLIAATGFKPGGTFSLTQLRAFTLAIADYYRSRGYFLAQANLPAQDIVDGAVTISVVEGQYGKVVVRNQSTLNDGVATGLLDGLDAGDNITIAPLESRLLQLSDLPGVAIKSTLVPGASVGASDLVVDIVPGKRWSGSLEADNSGGRYTGANRTGGTLNLNNPFGRGDVATLRALTSWDGLDYGRASYQMQIGRADAGVAYTALHYELGDSFASLDAHGTARIASIYGRYPLFRSRITNLYAQFNVDAKKFRDRIDAADIVADKKADVGMLSLVGDHRDQLGGGGVSSYSLTWSTGSLDLQSADALSTDAATAQTNGHYDKFGLSLMRLQRLTDTISLYAAAQGQIASQNLDVSEKIGLGGASGVRAYPEGEAYLDEGYILNVELRFALTRFAQLIPGQLQAIGFADTGSGRVSKDIWSDGDNSRTLSGGGVGLNWFDASRYSVKAYYARKLGSTVATSAPDADSRVWVSAVKYF